MMGSGKTSVGQLLSKYLNSTFYDLDDGIEKRFNLSIREIFKEHGEEKFREVESIMLAETENLVNSVISTGGGIVISNACLLYTSPSPRDQEASRMPSSA